LEDVSIQLKSIRIVEIAVAVRSVGADGAPVESEVVAEAVLE